MSGKPTARQCPGCGYLVTEINASALRFDQMCPRCKRWGIMRGFSLLFADRDKVVRAPIKDAQPLQRWKPTNGT